MAMVSFKEGTLARKAAAEVAESVKRSGSNADNPYAISRAVVKKMSPARRRALAARR